MKSYLCFLALLLGAVNGFGIDREAFAFTHYDLNIRVDPQQQRLGARGTITLRNDSQTPQRFAVLQISSSLGWHSIRAGNRQLQFVVQPYTSDIDHTGALSEAVVTLAEAVAPKQTVALDVAYEGVIALDATRLTRIGAPEAAAKSSDWDQISPKFTGVRGAGNVVWYPIATEAADLTETAGLSDVLDRWRLREAGASAHFQFAVQTESTGQKPEFLLNAKSCTRANEINQEFIADCSYEDQSLGINAPAFLLADFETIDRASIGVHYLAGHDTSAAIYADAADKAQPLITDWFGSPRTKPRVADLPDADAAPYETGSLLLTPLASMDNKRAGIIAAHQLTHAVFFSPRSWINEGLAHFAQVLYLEQQSGRQTALDYLHTHSTRLVAAGKQTVPGQDSASHSLVRLNDEELLRSKAMCVWWMLREMLGDTALKRAIASYRADQDSDPSYMQHLIQAQTQKDLEWFFDDWVYRDRGLPEFEVESAFVRRTLPEGFIVTITVVNSGTAGAEVPVTVKFAGGEVTERMVVRAKSNSVVRVTTLKLPEEVIVNDGSVPETDSTNNVFRIQESDIRTPAPAINQP